MFRYRLRTLLIALGLAPPAIAAVWLEPTGALLVGMYLFTLGGLLPVAAYLWRNSSSQ
jgi:hypothetical protein